MKSIKETNYGGWNKKKCNSKNYHRLQKKKQQLKEWGPNLTKQKIKR